MTVVSRSAIALAVAGLVAAPLAMAHDRGDQGMQGQQGQTEGYGRGHRGMHRDVRGVQQKLKDAGYDPGNIDGKMGPRTQAALKQFQQAQNLPATGRLDSQTMAALHTGGSATSGTHGTGASPQSGAGAQPRDTGTQGMGQGTGTQGMGQGAGTEGSPAAPANPSQR